MTMPDIGGTFPNFLFALRIRAFFFPEMIIKRRSSNQLESLSRDSPLKNAQCDGDWETWKKLYLQIATRFGAGFGPVPVDYSITSSIEIQLRKK